MLEYMDYIGCAYYDDKAGAFVGTVINSNDVITFQGTTVEEIENDFRKSIDDYLAWCQKDEITPDAPFKQDASMKITPEIHKKLSIVAKMLNISLEEFVERAINDEVKFSLSQHTIVD